MIKPVSAILPVFCLTLATGSVSAEDSIGYNLQATVPVICSIKFEAGGGTAVDGASHLGLIKEYCNAPGGYQLMVQYSPGSLRGAIFNVGDSRVVLDGSGTAIVPGARGPKIQSRELTIIPDPNGLDTDSLNIVAQPI